MADRGLDHDRKVALEQLPRELRPAFQALWLLDLAFADVVTTSSDSRLGAIRMAWWRERLEELDKGVEAPAEPRLQAVATELLPRGISGQELSQLENAWLPLLEPFPWGGAQSEALKLRGRILFGIGARLLGDMARETEPAGVVWSLVDGAHHCSDPQSRDHLLSEARMAIPSNAPSRQLRPLTTLGALAASDAKARGNAARVVAALMHQLIGRFA